ncbi:hypothetical protein RN001_004505 [Aquatica leii]|uniref:HTH psq-type domain-containing protein n=1 Tax=Aquatica leii TaxID=1421715 RepID=A0AAN7PEK8_9COLE|nr:hypothetical protein RN001_004505 [Aquatica leii]
MVRNRVRKTTIGQFDEHIMFETVKSTLSGGLSIRKAASRFNISRYTIFILEHAEPRSSIDFQSFKDNDDSSIGDTTNKHIDEEQLEEYVIDEGVLQSIPASQPSSNSSSVYSSSKKRKTQINTDNVMVETSNVLKAINHTITTTKKNNTNNDDDTVLANFVISKLKKISQDDVRLEVEEQMTQCLYEGIKKCTRSNVE